MYRRALQLAQFVNDSCSVTVSHELAILDQVSVAVEVTHNALKMDVALVIPGCGVLAFDEMPRVRRVPMLPSPTTTALPESVFV